MLFLFIIVIVKKTTTFELHQIPNIGKKHLKTLNCNKIIHTLPTKSK